jgi:DNA polymerase-4
MPMFKALEACPEAVVIAPDMEKYVRVGRVRALMQALTPLVEPIHRQAFRTCRYRASAWHAARRGAGAVRLASRRIPASVSAGLSYCKFLAKIASIFASRVVFGHQRGRGGRISGEQPVT